MSTVIRVKRLLEEEPLDTIIVNCKKRKLNDNDVNYEANDHITGIFKLAGTLKNEVNIISSSHKAKPKITLSKYIILARRYFQSYKKLQRQL